MLGICELERGQNCNYRGVHVNDGHFGASECRSGTAEKNVVCLFQRREEKRVKLVAVWGSLAWPATLFDRAHGGWRGGSTFCPIFTHTLSISK